MNNIIKRVWNQNRLVNIEDLTGMVFQAEDGGHTFEISGVDDTGAAVELSGTVAGVFVRPDNADIALTGSASGGVVSVTLDEDCYAVPGRFGLTIFVTSDDQKVAVYACVGTVSRTSTGGVAGDTPQDVVDLINAINAAISDLNSAIGQIPASYANVMAAIAPTYSGSALYSVGSYAWYNGSLYSCITAITTAEEWTAAHWTAVALGNDVSDIKSAFDDINKGELYRGIVKGRYVNNSTKVLSNYSAYDGSRFIDISGLDSIVVTNGGNQSTIWNGFFATEADTTAISTFTVMANETKVVDVPSGANYVILSHYTAQYPLLTIQSRISRNLENLNAEVDAQATKNTSLTNEIDIAIKNSVSDYAFYFNPLEFELGNISVSGFEPYNRRVASQKIFQNDMVTHVKSVGDYKFYINLLNDDESYQTTSGWVNDYTVPSGQKFMMMFSPYGSDVSHILDANLIPEYIVNLYYSFETEYEYPGERLIPKKQGYAIKKLGITPTDSMLSNSQGLVVYEHTLFQIVGDVDGIGGIVLVNLDTNAIIKSYGVSVGHGGCAFFLDEFYDQSDSYPLLCVCTNEHPNVIRVFRLTASTAVKVREYHMQEADGYWAQVTYDSQTGLLYSIGYSANSFMDATGNRSVIATYDILTATETSANVFEPTLVSRYAIPFIYCTQGLKYYAGKLIVVSSFDHNVQDSRLYIIQPASRQILGIIKDFPILIAQWEVEGIDIVDDEWVLIGTRPRYFKMTLY